MKLNRKYQILRILIIIFLIGAILGLAMDILALTSGQSIGNQRNLTLSLGKSLIKDLLNLAIAFGLYRSKKWAYYPGLVWEGVGISLVIFSSPGITPVLKVFWVALELFFIWLLLSCKKFFVK